MQILSFRFGFFQSGAILESACALKLYTAGHWSTTRPAVFFLGTKDGNVQVCHEPLCGLCLLLAVFFCVLVNISQKATFRFNILSLVFLATRILVKNEPRKITPLS